MGSETFELQRFGWASPDRLEIDGRFIGLGDVPGDDPVLVLRGTDRTHRLPAVSDGKTGKADGSGWHAAFAWQEAPTAFDVAHLELGEDLMVELPTPRLEAEESGPEILDVRRRGGGERLRLQSELLSVQSELREVAARLARSEEELNRARADLGAERDARAKDAEVFRAGLAQTHEAAEEAVAEVRAEADALRERVEELAHVGEEASRLRDRLASIREILDD